MSFRAEISVVIPTTGGDTLAKAVESVNSQTVPVSELIVVGDTLSELQFDSRHPVKELRVGPGAGANAARQAGIRAAKGELIALLDDDDVWHPEKLERQLALIQAHGKSDAPWLCSCKVRATDGRGTPEIWPNDPIRPGETIAEYVLQKKRVRGGLGFVQTSTMLFERQLALAVPFNSELKFHQDLEWMVRLSEMSSPATLIQSEHALVDYAVQPSGVSSSIHPTESSAWGIKHLSACDPRSRGDFLMTIPVILASRRGEPQLVWRAIWTAASNSRPGIHAYIFALAQFALSLRSFFERKAGARTRS